MALEDHSRQRLDFSTGPDGEEVATLTVTLSDGSIHVFTASATDEELQELAPVFAKAEARGLAVEGMISDDEIAGIFGDIAKGIGKGLKGIAKGARKLAGSKVFRTAAAGLAMAAPALGPFAPIAMGASAAMGVAGKLSSAAIAAEAGAKRAARALGRGAKRYARKKTRSSRSARSLLGDANRKRKNAAKLAGKKKRKKKKSTTKWGKLAAAAKRAKKKKKKGKWAKAKKGSKPKRKKKKKGLSSKQKAARRAVKRSAKRAAGPNLLAASSAGALRSSEGGNVSLATLADANKRGRVFWVAA